MCVFIIIGEQGEISLKSKIENYNFLNSNQIKKTFNRRTSTIAPIRPTYENSNPEANRWLGYDNKMQNNSDIRQYEQSNLNDFEDLEKVLGKMNPLEQLEKYILEIKKLCLDLEKVT